MKYIFAVAISFFVTQAYADSWAAAKVAGLVSPTGQVVVRVVPGSNLADVYGFSGSQKGEVATAIIYRLNATANYVKYQELPLLNPIAPVFAAVADSGELVTLDNWHNIGTGDAVAVVTHLTERCFVATALQTYTTKSRSKNSNAAYRQYRGGARWHPC